MKILSFCGFLFLSANLYSENCSDAFCREIAKGNFGYVLEMNSNQTVDLGSALVSSIKSGSYEITLFLLENGARTDFETAEGDTPLILSVKMQLLTPQLLKMILRNGAALEHTHRETGMTAMMYAASNGYVSGIQLLSDAGASMDRINLRDNKMLIEYSANEEVFEFLMKSHRYLAKSLNRYGFALEYDEMGFARRLAMGADGVVYKVFRNGQEYIAKFCYNRAKLWQDGVFEYQICKDDDSALGIQWSSLFKNPMRAERYDFFTVKTLVKGATLSHWMSSRDPHNDIASKSPRAILARSRLKEFVIRMLRADAGFVGDLNASNLIFSEELLEWVVIDGHKMVACYSTTDHEWIWTEYCEAAIKMDRQAILAAFKSYAVGQNPTPNPADDGAFGVWLQGRAGVVPTKESMSVIASLISSISPAELN